MTRWILFLLAFAILQTFGQTPGAETVQNSSDELFHFKFTVGDVKDLAYLTRIVSIDRVDGETVFAFANGEEFEEFLNTGLDFSLLPLPNEGFDPLMADWNQIQAGDTWDFYPTYDAYVSMMFQFEADYPALCDVFSIGNTVNGRQLLVARISDNVGVEEDEPEFLYTSSMHGDELTGYILMLRLIDSLLTAYGSDPRITNLVNSMDIFINPLANPDGTYYAGNTTVSGAIRYNANSVDLNRNYPDPVAGPHPDNKPWQPETIAFMNFAESRDFSMAANFHGGTEVFNYPWDHKYGLAADDAWWQYVGHEYADTAQAFSPSNYMNLFDDGITNGAAWYLVYGGRQDYMNFNHQCREVTIEISDVKLVPASQLNAHWEYNRRSLLNYMEQALFGLRGIVTDAFTGMPLEAEVFVLDHESDSSWVYSSLPAGNYHRYLAAGTYNVRISAPCHLPQVYYGVVVQNYQTTVLNVQLEPAEADFYASATQIQPGVSVNFFDNSCIVPTSWLWTFEGGIPASSNLQNPQNIIYPNAGTFDVKLVISDGMTTDSTFKPDYINVQQTILMSNGTLNTCSALFYDSGGPSGTYTDNENLALTLYPANPAGKVKVEFIQFSIEYHASCSYDYLRIYNGPATTSPLIGTYCGTNSPETVVSTHASGALTFVFHSDISVVDAGWKAQVTCETQPAELDLTLLLQGPFSGTQMGNVLAASGFLPASQPYGVMPWNYPGTETAPVIPEEAVDWVLVELRDAPTALSATPATTIARQALLLMQSGEVRSVDGSSLPGFDANFTSQLWVVVYHRNHVPVMSSEGLPYSNGVFSWDFTSGMEQAYGISAQADLGNGLAGLYAGDANGDGMIDDLDKTSSWETEAGSAGYIGSDLNLDGQSNNTDKNELWNLNQGISEQIPD